MVGKLNTSIFISLSTDIKNEFARVFNIPKNGKTHVVDNIVREDGYLNVDLEKIGVPELQKYLDSTHTDFFVLYTEAVNRVETSLRPAEVKKVEKEVNEIDIRVEGDTIHVTTPKKITKTKINKNHAEKEDTKEDSDSNPQI